MTRIAEIAELCTAWKVSVFGVILAPIFRQSECGKIRTRITPNMDAFYAVFEDTKDQKMGILWAGWINQRKYSKVTIILQETLIFRKFFL